MKFIGDRKSYTPHFGSLEYDVAPLDPVGKLLSPAPPHSGVSLGRDQNFQTRLGGRGKQLFT